MIEERELGKLMEELGKLRMYKKSEYIDKLCMSYLYFRLIGEHRIAELLWREIVGIKGKEMRVCFKPLLGAVVDWTAIDDPVEKALCIASRKVVGKSIPHLFDIFLYLKENRDKISVEKYIYMVLWLRIIYMRMIDEEFVGSRILTIDDILKGGGLN